jgi:hypothetical protein
MKVSKFVAAAVACSVCGRKVTSFKLRRHTKNTHFFGAVCCNKAFRSWEVLWNHVTTIHFPNGRPISLRCNKHSYVNVTSYHFSFRSRSIDQSIQSSVEESSEQSDSSIVVSHGHSDSEDVLSQDSDSTTTKMYHLPLRPKLPGKKLWKFVHNRRRPLKSQAIADLSRRLRKHHITVEGYKSLFFHSIISKISGMARHLKQYQVTTIQTIFRQVSTHWVHNVHHASVQ